VYIPMGGNRDTQLVTLRNLVLVFFLCGLWHGAAWTFVVWGLYHGLLLLIERFVSRQSFYRPPRLARWVYTFLVVMGGWVLFRSKSLGDAVHFYSALMGRKGVDWHSHLMVSQVQWDKVLYLSAGLIVALVPYGWLFERKSEGYAFRPVHAGAALVILVLSVIMMSAGGFTPFIYFRF